MSRSPSNNPYGNAVMVERLIGTAYDNVKKVAENLPIIDQAGMLVEGLREEVDEAIASIGGIPESIAAAEAAATNSQNYANTASDFATQSQNNANAAASSSAASEGFAEESAQSAALASDIIKVAPQIFSTRADMVAAAPFTEGKWLEVLRDENFKFKPTVYQYISGAFVLRKVSKEIPSFDDFGIVDDDPGTGVVNGTNNDAAWAALLAATANGDHIRVPKTSTGIYYFATNTLLGMANRELDTQGEVITFRGPAIMGYSAGSAGPKYAKGLIKLWNTSLDMKFDIMSDLRKAPKNSFISDGDLDYSRVSNVDMTQLRYERVVWPTGDTWQTFTGEGVTSNSRASLWTQSSMLGGQMYAATLVPKYGHQYSWNNRRDPINATGIWAIFVRTENYYNVFYAQQDTGGIMFGAKAPGVDAVQYTLPALEGQSTQNDLFLCNAHITLDIIDPYSFQFAVNGVTLYTGELPEPIMAIGPGAFASGSGIIISEMMHEISNPVPLAPRPKRILIIGDSNSDKINMGWPDDLGEIMQDSLGCQIEHVRNIAVAGDAIANQLDALNALGSLSGFTDCVTMIGTNNGQGQTLYDTFESDLRLITDKTQAVGMNHVLVSPANFYSRALAQANGGFGQDTSNFEKVSAYRTRIANEVGYRQALGQRFGLVDANRVIGAILPKYINTFPAGTAGSEIDRAMMDNIHLTRRAKRKLAHAVGEKLLAVERRVRNPGLQLVVPAAWFRNGWDNAIPGTSSTYGITPDGRKWIRLFVAPGSATADGTAILQLPRHMWPHPAQGSIYTPCLVNSDRAGRIDVNWNGVIQIAGASGGSQLGAYVEYF